MGGQNSASLLSLVAISTLCGQRVRTHHGLGAKVGTLGRCNVIVVKREHGLIQMGMTFGALQKSRTRSAHLVTLQIGQRLWLHVLLHKVRNESACVFCLCLFVFVCVWLFVCL